MLTPLSREVVLRVALIGQVRAPRFKMRVLGMVVDGCSASGSHCSLII